MDKKGLVLEVNNEEYGFEYPKAKLTLCNYTIYFYKEFNWFHRLMLRLAFGLKVENINGSDK